eukprot:CAMPEP_0204292294 /NCGR_PEP_ID=MMETSP0468-20130131/64069_1 /ASSEMBLY_ACC=CAM_ASM_000383 /TAXON_ID=2969 /ORGANISM="Oxyrrhis marina" /LENGTH=86 /DNA_ID=CAMNT_0051270669 /DNA_START=152 /DNA_END=412 /DNA_ORIENTATION=+
MPHTPACTTPAIPSASKGNTVTPQDPWDPMRLASRREPSQTEMYPAATPHNNEPALLNHTVFSSSHRAISAIFSNPTSPITTMPTW